MRAPECRDTRPTSTHATRWAWDFGCRCPASIGAHDLYVKERNARRATRQPAVWPLYSDDVDELSVEAVLAGSGGRCTRGERLEAVRILTGHGYTSVQIAERLRVSARTVERYRSRLRQIECAA